MNTQSLMGVIRSQCCVTIKSHSHDLPQSAVITLQVLFILGNQSERLPIKMKSIVPIDVIIIPYVEFNRSTKEWSSQRLSFYVDQVWVVSGQVERFQRTVPYVSFGLKRMMDC